MGETVDRSIDAGEGLSRRSFLARAGIAAGAAAALAGSGTAFDVLTAGREAGAATWWVPGEAAPHVRTWMAWPSSSTIWGNKLLKGVQADVATIAKTIAKYEPVIMCADGATAATAARAKCGTTVQVISSIPVNDCWMRDTGPVFRVNGTGGRDAFGLNFNGWGGKQMHAKDALVAQRVASYVGVPFSAASIVGEGGAILFDGDGTLAANESSLVNSNRNGTKTRATIEAELLSRFGATKMLWFPGIKGQDITDDHIDGDLQFVSPGVIADQWPIDSDTSVWANDARNIYNSLGTMTDAKGRSFSRNKLVNPDMTKSRIGAHKPDALNLYANYYPVNGALITNNYGDTAADAAAKTVLQNLYPGRIIEMLNIDTLVGDGGGAVHCVTMEEPIP